MLILGINWNWIRKTKKIIICICLVTFILICFLVYFLSTNNERKINNIVTSFLNSIIKNDYTLVNEYLESNFDFSNVDYFNQENENIYLSKLDYSIKNIKIDNELAVVTISLKHPNVVIILKDNALYLSQNLFSSKTIDEQ